MGKISNYVRSFIGLAEEDLSKDVIRRAKVADALDKYLDPHLIPEDPRKWQEGAYKIINDSAVSEKTKEQLSIYVKEYINGICKMAREKGL